MSSALNIIANMGGDVLNKNYLLHRTIGDILEKIRASSLNELNRPDEDGKTLMHYAASTKDGLPIVKALIKKGVNPAMIDKNMNKPVHFAKDAEVVVLLLSVDSACKLYKPAI